MDRYKCEKHGSEWIGKCPRCLEEASEQIKDWLKPSKSSMGLMLKEEDAYGNDCVNGACEA